ncbi:lamin tail domain-containing protein [Labilithrix luteola]|nr:lamin tail domain-containing protein [Labilithrix luteola]
MVRASKKTLLVGMAFGASSLLAFAGCGDDMATTPSTLGQIDAGSKDARARDATTDSGKDAGKDASKDPTEDDSGTDPEVTKFNVTAVSSTGSTQIKVAFDAPPNATEAVDLANYAAPGLTFSGTPSLSGSTVTLTTSAQENKSYTLTVSNVTRASDGEALSATTATFKGTVALPTTAPTVTNVVVSASNPDNGAIPYNTGTATVVITGTGFAGIDCAAATKPIKLDDLDGLGTAVGTTATSCTVDSATQVTATFPAGIRTNGATGWNVLVTNVIGANTSSAVKFVPVAGLVISEIYTGTSGNTDHEYVEIYNRTSKSIDVKALGIHLHTLSSGGTGANKALTYVTAGVIPSHGFLVFASAASTAADSWFNVRDITFSAASAGLVGNGGVYISLSTTEAVKVLDKVGWGKQPATGFEGNVLPDIASNYSVERKPAGGAGHSVDTDDNKADFNAASTTLTPRGTASAAQP